MLALVSRSEKLREGPAVDQDVPDVRDVAAHALGQLGRFGGRLGHVGAALARHETDAALVVLEREYLLGPGSGFSGSAIRGAT